ncbi:MAG TPA: indolepyruvate ferredoxin oxidoreductase family protein [Myxococcales bacterium]|nr:indolepyruvate ferredoxin oxidoreductase family protein [Myxococcales bacterium]
MSSIDSGGNSVKTPRAYALDDRYLADEGRVFLTGIQALARLPLEQLRVDRRNGLNTAALISGYPGSPLGGYDRAVAAAARLAPQLPIRCRPAMNEEYGVSAIMGSQLAAMQPDCLYDGIVGLWYGKAPGVDRAADAIRHAVYAGASMKGGAVAIVGDDPAAKSSTIPSSSAGVLADMHLPLLYPGDPAEALDLGRHAIALSRLTGLWSALKIVADVADATATVDLHPNRITPIMPRIGGRIYEHYPNGNLLTPRTIDVEQEIYETRYQLARDYATENQLNLVTVDPSDAWIGIIASGITYREVREAFGRLGLSSEAEIEACGIRLLKMGMPMPFNPETVRDFAKGLEEVLVIEEKRPGVESLVKDALYGSANSPRIVGKFDETGAVLVRGHGSLDADLVMEALRRRLGSRLRDKLQPERHNDRESVPALSVLRTPYFCSGCPHNRSIEVPSGSLVGAGIGCHTMALFMDEARVGNIGGLGCMGNEGVQWIGMSDFLSREHFIQNIGDGTFFHSGQLAVQASVAAGVNVTYKLLYNGTVAMTGGQDPQAQLGIPELASNLLRQGVAEVLVTTNDVLGIDRQGLPPEVEVWGRDRLVEAQKRLAMVRGTTVLIHVQPCAAEERRARTRDQVAAPPHRVIINSRICEGCGDCGRVSNCLSVQPVETPFGRKTEIDQTTCNLDYSCLEGDCPSFMTITLRPPALGSVPSSPPSAATVPMPTIDLPMPERIVPEDEFAMRITGIGGTGVVTVAQIVGTAAMLDDYHVRGLDQIGLSQKAGPVVSDLRFSRTKPTSTNRLGAGQADLLLAFDQLVAASEKGLHTADPERTTVVGSTTPTPTGDMIGHLDIELPCIADLCKRIAGETRGRDQFWAEASATMTDLFGNSTTSNIFVVGMAVQAGCLPVTPECVEEAIRLNGVAVDSNVAAFRWGRAQIVDPEMVSSARGSDGGRGPVTAGLAISLESSLLEGQVAATKWVVDQKWADQIAALDCEEAATLELTRYASELVAWGGASAVTMWLEVLQDVRKTERVAGLQDQRLVRAVGPSLFKLIAYKDEYEVARLMTDAETLALAHHVAEGRGRIAWKLHPPLLKAFGLQRKISFGLWAAPFFRLLARGRVLRGTPLDPFGRAKLRKLERELPGEYISALRRVLERLGSDTNPENVGAAMRLAKLPDQIRGYEDLKIERIDQYRVALARALRAGSV